MTYQEACAYLYSLERRGVRLGLDRIVGALREHGDPQESFGSVLVGGTNGKGSVCAVAASVLQAAGHRTGLFSSPHLLDLRERMRLDGRMITPGEVTDLLARIRGSIERWHLSFFEATTLVAFLWFRERGVEVASVEVGLGGRLDATRPVRALATVITNIGLDHVRILGATRAEIAGEKAGILRHGTAVVLGVSAADALGVLRDRAEQLGASIYERRRCLRIAGLEGIPQGTRFRVVARPGQPGPSRELTLEIGLAGRHQVANAALAILALSLLPGPYRIGDAALVRGLGRVRWPGRCEEISISPLILCDVAHNLDGARSLAAVLAERYKTRCRLVVGMVDGKDHRGFLAALAGRLGMIHFCTPQVERALPGEKLAAVAATVGLRGRVHTTPADAIDAALAEQGRDEPILVTGSFFTVGEVLRHLRIEPVEQIWSGEPIEKEEGIRQ